MIIDLGLYHMYRSRGDVIKFGDSVVNYVAKYIIIPWYFYCVCTGGSFNYSYLRPRAYIYAE